MEVWKERGHRQDDLEPDRKLPLLLHHAGRRRKACILDPDLRDVCSGHVVHSEGETTPKVSIRAKILHAVVYPVYCFLEEEN